MALIIVFQNVSQLAPISDYKVQVLVGDGSPERSKTLYAGVVKGHTRDDGYLALVRLFLESLEG